MSAVSGLNMFYPNKDYQVLTKFQKILAILALLLVASCNEVEDKEPEVKPTEPVVIVKPEPTPEPNPVPDHIEAGWFKKYEDFLATQIDSTKTPHMMKFNSNMKFWMLVFRSMASAESGLKPWTTYWEKSLGVSCLSVWDKDRCEQFIKNWNLKQTGSSRYAFPNQRGWDNATKSFYLSEGLLQLSYSDKQYYGCDFDWEKDQYKLDDDRSKTIFDPYKNLACGVVIMERQLKRHGQLYNNQSYWAVLRTNRKSHTDYMWYYNRYKSEYGY